MCLRCSNCFKKNSDLAHRLPDAVEASCTIKERFIERDEQDFEDDVDLVIDAGREYAAGVFVVLGKNPWSLVINKGSEGGGALLIHTEVEWKSYKPAAAPLNCAMTSGRAAQLCDVSCITAPIVIYW